MKSKLTIKIEKCSKVIIKSNPKSVWIVVKPIDSEWFLLQNSNTDESHQYTSARFDNLDVVFI